MSTLLFVINFFKLLLMSDQQCGIRLLNINQHFSYNNAHTYVYGERERERESSSYCHYSKDMAMYLKLIRNT